MTKLNSGLVIYQEHQILSEFGTGEKFTADSQRMKENNYLPAIATKPGRNRTVF